MQKSPEQIIEDFENRRTEAVRRRRRKVFRRIAEGLLFVAVASVPLWLSLLGLRHDFDLFPIWTTVCFLFWLQIQKCWTLENRLEKLEGQLKRLEPPAEC